MFRSLLSKKLVSSHTSTGRKLKSRHKALARRRNRKAMFESLESRQLLATLYVDNPGDFSVTNDQGAPGLDSGDTVTWNPGVGSAHGGPVAGLTYGTYAFGSLGSAVGVAVAGDTVKVAGGTFNEGINIGAGLTGLTLQGNQFGIDARSGRSGANETIISNAGGSFGIYASNVTVDGFTLQDQTNANAAPGFGYNVYMAPGQGGRQLLNNIIQNNIVGVALSNNGASQAVIQHNLIRNNNNSGPSQNTGIYTDEYTSGGTVSNVLIDANRFEGHGDNINGGQALGFSSTTAGSPSTNITISGNDFVNNARALYAFRLTNSSIVNNTVSGSTWAASADLRLFEGVDNVSITGNFLQNGAGRALRSSNASTGLPLATNVTFNNNSITGYTGPVDTVVAVTGQYTGTLNAESNWWGTNAAASVAAKISGSVDNDPWLAVGTDTSPAVGFQPDTSIMSTAGGSGTTIPTTTLADSITVVKSGSNTVVTVTNTSGTSTYTLDAVDNLTIPGGDGNDSLLVDFTGGDPVPAGGIVFNGGNGDDALSIRGTGGQAVKYTPDAATNGNGSIDFGGGKILTFTGLEPVDFDNVGTFTLSLPGTNDNVTLTNGFNSATTGASEAPGTVPAMVFTGDSGGVGFEAAHVFRTTSVNVDTTTVDGTDIITITSADNAHANTNLFLTTGAAGTDVLHVNGAVSIGGTFSALGLEDINLSNNITAPTSITGDSPKVDVLSTSAQIQDGIKLAGSGGTVSVVAGTFTENLVLNKSLTLKGAQFGVDGRGRVVGAPNPAVESVLTAGSGIILELQSGSASSIIDGFAFSGSTRGIESTTGPINNVQLLNNHFAGQTGNAVFLNDNGQDMTINRNEFVGSATSSTVFHMDTDAAHGLHFTNNNILRVGGVVSTGFFVDGNRNIGTSVSLRTPLVQGNLFQGHSLGMNAGQRAFANAQFVENTFTGNSSGFGGGPLNSTFARNTLSSNLRAGLRLTGFGGSSLTDATKGAQNTLVTNNVFTGNGSTVDLTNGYGDLLIENQFNGTQSTNTIANNSFGSTINVFNLESNPELIRVSGNWWGTTANPETAGKILGVAAANVDYSPWLNASTDTDLVTAGFQGDFSTLNIDDDSPISAQNGGVARVQEAVDLLADGALTGSARTINVLTGTYSESSLAVAKSATIDGDDTTTPTINGGATTSVSVSGANTIIVKDLMLSGTMTAIGNTGITNLTLDNISSTQTSSWTGTTGTVNLKTTTGNDTATADGMAFSISTNALAAISYAGGAITNLNIDTKAGDDTINVTAPASGGTLISVDGNTHGAPGDTLVYDATGASITINPASITSATRQTVNYTNIENLQIANAIIQGTAAADTIVVSFVSASPYKIQYVLNGGTPVVITNPVTFTFNGSGGDDLMTVDLSAGDAIPSGGIFFNGEAEDNTVGAPTPNHGDVLKVIGNGTTTTAEYRAFGTPGATNKNLNVNTSDGLITATGVEPGDITGMATVNLYFDNADEVISINSGFDAGTGLIPALTVTGTTGGNPYEGAFLWNNTTVNIDTSNISLGGTDGNDTITINGGTNAHLNTNLNIVTGLGTDSVLVPSSLTVTGTIGISSQAISFTGGTLTAGAASTITLNSGTGAITTSGVAIDVVALNLSATSTTGVDLDTTVTNITASASAAGSIRFDETNAVTLTSVTTLNGSITVNAGGTVTATHVTNTTDASNVIMIVTTAGDILANNIVAPGDTITLNAAGFIEETSPGDGTSDISADLINLTAVSGIGSLGTIEINGDFDPSRGLTASVTGVGLIDLLDVNALRIRSATTLNGNITIVSATSNLTVETVNAGGVASTATLTATTGAIIDGNAATLNVTAINLAASAATGIDLDTTVTNITASTTGAGSILLDETNGVTLTSVTSANGPITITTGGTTIVTSVVSSTDLDANDISITASTGDISFSAANAVNAGTTLGDVTITATVGAIVDTLSDALTDVTGQDVSLSASSDIGQTGTAHIDTRAVNLTTSSNSAVVAGTHGTWINEFDSVTVVSATTTDGVIVIDAGTSLTATLVDAVGTSRNARLRALGGDLSIGSVTALGDIVSLSATAAITDGDAGNDVSALSLMMSAGSGIALGGDPLETSVTNLAWSSGSGGAFVANIGTLTIGSITFPVGPATITGGTGSGAAAIIAASPLTVASNVVMGGAVSLAAGETATEDVDNLAVNAGVTVQSTGSSVTLNAGDNVTISSTSSILAATTVTINVDSGDLDATGETLLINTGAVITAPGGATFNGGAQADSFTFAPQALGTAIVVNGFAPTVIPGDVLNLDLTGATGSALTIDGTNDGTFTFTNRASVEYNSIEDVNATGGCYDLTLNMATFGASGDFTVRRNAPSVGTKLEIVNSVGPTVVFTADLADIAQLKVNGTANADTLTVDDVNGMVSFDPLCIPSTVFPDNANSAGVARLYFDGAAGVNVLNFQLAESGTAQVYAVGSGAAPGTGEGEVLTTNTAGRNLVTYFRNLGPSGSVNRTGAGASAGALTVLGDANGNTLTTTAAAGLTTVNPATYTPFTFAPGGNYSQLNLQGAAGNDTYHINGAGAAGLDNLLIPVVVTDSSGNDSLFVNDSTDTTSDTATITQAGIDGLNPLAGDEISFSGIETLDVTGTSAGDTLTTNLGGAVASPTDFAGLVTVNIRGNGGNDTMFLHVADSTTDASLNFVNLFGDAGGDTFGSATDKLNPVLRTGQTQIAAHGGAAAATPGPGVPFNPFGEAGDKLFLDMSNTFSGTTITPVVIVDTNGGYADSANTQTFRFTGIEDLDLYDNGVLTNTAIGDFFLRATESPDYILFMSAAQVNPVFRIRVGNQYYPTNGGNYGPYTTGVSKIYVYGRGGNDTISMYNTRLNAAFFGEAGDDILTGGYGNDLLVGGTGNDRINGGTVGGNDEIWGDDFNPALDNPSVASQVVSGGNDQINTFGGSDTIYGQGGNDIINSGNGDDYINGGAGDDLIDGQAGNDRIYGGDGNDVISGSDGNDLVAGNDGNDTLYGRVGNDILIGGLGKDILNGNEGGDALVGDESNGLGSKSLAKGDAVDAALLALLLAWGSSPTLGSLGGFDSAAADGSEDTLYGGANADAFFGLALLLDKAPDRVFPGQDLN